MSKVTINNNLNPALELFNTIQDKSPENLLFNCLQMQANLLRKYYNKKVIEEKLYLPKDEPIKKVINYYYKHVYIHNFLALHDELFEINNAFDVVSNYNKNADLLIEEIIDVFHFVLQYVVFIKENMVLYETMQNNLTLDGFSKLIIDRENSTEEEKKFFIDFNDSLKLESKAMETASKTNQYYVHEYDTSEHSILFRMIKYNRDILRHLNWKHWKDYSEDFYDILKFSYMLDLNRKIFNNLYSLLERTVTNKHYTAQKDLNNMSVYELFFIFYVSKNIENAMRQFTPEYNHKVKEEDKQFNLNIVHQVSSLISK